VEAEGAGNGKWYKKKISKCGGKIGGWIWRVFEGWDGCGCRCEYGWMDGDDVDDDVFCFCDPEIGRQILVDVKIT